MESIQNVATRGRRYAIVTPVRDEEDYIGGMIESVLAQELRPSKWVIVDDGSTDKTAVIVEWYAEGNSFIELLRLPERGQREAGGEAAIVHAFRRLRFEEYDFIARFDADLLFSPDYIVRIMEEFERDPQLGIAGGGLYVNKNGGLELETAPDYHVRGALKMYRRQCLEQVGGLTTQIGWDTIDEIYAWSKGWKTKSLFQYRVIHRRPTGEGIKASRIYWERGKAEYYTWSHPIFVLGKTLKVVYDSRGFSNAASFLGGFLSCYLTMEKRLQDPVFSRTRRGQQLRRIASMFRASGYNPAASLIAPNSIEPKDPR